MTPSASRPPRLDDLITRATAVDGSPPFSDGALIDPARELVWLGAAAALVSETEAEFVVDPDARRHGLGTAMLEHLLGSGDRLFWAHGDSAGARSLAASHGLVPVRTLLHLELEVSRARRDLPREFPTGEISTGSIRASGSSSGWEDRLLALNARAFAHHPEQGSLTRADLDALMAEPWFDSDDLLLAWEGETLLGFCWLKNDEFYVVGVDPAAQGRGLGRELMNAGVARLTEKGLRMSHLYVEGDNEPALALYRNLGFTNRSVDVQYGTRHDAPHSTWHDAR